MLKLPRHAGYQNYNTVAKKLDRRLTALGAAVICERGLGDDQHPNGYEAALDPWLRKLWSELRAKYPLPHGLSQVHPAAAAIACLPVSTPLHVPTTVMPCASVICKTGQPPQSAKLSCDVVAAPRLICCCPFASTTPCGA